MKKLSFLAALLPLLFCACSSFIEENSAPIIPAISDLQAGFADETRTYVENGRYLRWHEDDRLTAFYGNTLNRQYKFKGKTGDNSGSFAHVPSGDLETGNAFDRIYALYPYNETTTITDEGEISLTLPALQSYAENSFGRGANTMIAVTENLEDTFLAFKNACGYLKLKLYNADGATVKSIEVKGNNGEKIAGAATATIAFGEAPVLLMADDATDTITIDCGDGVSLGTTAETATEFWTVIPQTTFTKGITIKITDSQGGIFEKSTDNEVAITRNAIQPMALVGVESAPAVVKPANNEIYYTNGSTTESIKLSNYYAFGAKYKSNKYDAVKKCWVLKFEGDVTQIGPSAFSECSNLTSITIPESVTSIGEYAFKDCSSLTSIIIPEGVTSIGKYAFYRCSSLTSISIPKSVTSIGTYAFYGCTGELIVNCDIPSATSNMSGYGTFYGSNFTSATIGKGVTSIGNYAFDACTSLTSVTIPEGVTSIGESAFYRCSSLTSISIPNSVTEIGESAFIYCSALISVTIGNSVTTIGDGAFYDCKNLKSITIPNGVTSIGKYAFNGCTRLTSVTIPEGVTSIGDGAFERCASLTSVTIPEGVTSIGESAFRSSSLTSVTIPYGVTTIARYTFEYCSDLTSITIPNSVTSIKQDAFNRCSSLTSITIPESVTEIVGWALRNCTSLTSVYCQATTPPSLGSQAFYNSSNLNVIYVPANSVEKYTSATNWISYAYCIVGYDLYEVVDMGLSVKWAATNVGADSPEELGNLYAWGEVSPKTEYYSSNYAWWTYDYSEDGDGWWSTTSIKKYGSSYSNSDYIQEDGYYASYYWVNDGLTVLDLEDDAARTEWGGTWRMPTQAECQELVDNCTIEKVKYNNCDGFLFTSTKAGYTDKKLFFPLTPSKELGDETTYDRYYSGLFWSSTQYLPFPVCAYVFRSSYPYTSCTLGPITRKAGFPVRPVKQ